MENSVEDISEALRTLRKQYDGEINRMEKDYAERFRSSIRIGDSIDCVDVRDGGIQRARTGIVCHLYVRLFEITRISQYECGLFVQEEGTAFPVYITDRQVKKVWRNENDG